MIGFRRMLDRNIAVLALVVLFGQLLGGALYYHFVLRPQVEQVAQTTVILLNVIDRAMELASPERQPQIMAELNRDGTLQARMDNDPPRAHFRPLSPMEYTYIRLLNGRSNHHGALTWRGDERAQVWLRMRFGSGYYWIAITPPRRLTPVVALTLTLLTSLLVSVAGGLVLQRYLARPLRGLAAAVDAYHPDRWRGHLAEIGPMEVAAVARAFNRMTARLANQEHERELMLAAVSHDLRTPLTRLRLSLEMMRECETELLDGARLQVDRIETMLAQFLDFARGAEREPLEQVDISVLLLGIAMDSGFGRNIHVSAWPGLEARVRPLGLARAVSNLVTNACTHGRPPIHVAARRERDQLVIAVGDSGPGMDSSHADTLRRPFARGDEARGDPGRSAGVGLGLAIVERVAAAHGGTLNFSRASGLFWARITLPHAFLAISSDAPAGDPGHSGVPMSGKGGSTRLGRRDATPLRPDPPA